MTFFFQTNPTGVIKNWPGYSNTPKNAGLICLIQMLVSACWVIVLGAFLYFYPGAGSFFFYLTTGLTLSPVKLLNNAAAESTGFLSPQKTIAAIERPMAQAVCLVAWRDRSVAQRSSEILFIDGPSSAQVLQKVSLVCLQNHHGVQGSTSLTHCLESFPHQHRCQSARLGEENRLFQRR